MSSEKSIEKTEQPKAVATPTLVPSKYKYIGPAGAEKVLIPKTVKSISTNISDAEIETLFQTYPGMAKLFEVQS